MIKKDEILQKLISKDDKMLYAYIIDKIRICESKHITTFSPFLPAIKCKEILNTILGKISCKIKIFGEDMELERLMLCFYNEYEKENISFDISILEISYNKKYAKTLNHRNFLGSIMGLGVQREKIGDIILDDENKAICFVSNDIKDYILINLDKVGASKVSVKEFDAYTYKIPAKKFEPKHIIIPSTRLDSIVSSAFNISRGKASELIKANKVLVNTVEVNSVSKSIMEGDIITLRGFGKIKIKDIKSKTKKDNIVLNILKYV